MQISFGMEGRSYSEALGQSESVDQFLATICNFRGNRTTPPCWAKWRTADHYEYGSHLSLETAQARKALDWTPPIPSIHHHAVETQIDFGPKTKI